MTSVSEQLQLYRAFKAQQGVSAGRLSPDWIRAAKPYPTTREYFDLLMKRWKSNTAKK